MANFSLKGVSPSLDSFYLFSPQGYAKIIILGAWPQAVLLEPSGQGQEQRKGHRAAVWVAFQPRNQGVRGTSSIQFTDRMIRITLFQVIG